MCICNGCFVPSEPFEESFVSQLNALATNNPQSVCLRYTLKLPNQHRYQFVEFNHLYSELSKAFKRRYPLGFEIINLSPSSKDDHFINVVLKVNLQ